MTTRNAQAVSAARVQCWTNEIGALQHDMEHARSIAAHCRIRIQALQQAIADEQRQWAKPRQPGEGRG